MNTNAKYEAALDEIITLIEGAAYHPDPSPATDVALLKEIYAISKAAEEQTRAP